MKEGYGVFFYHSGNRYEGNWTGDLKNGKGTTFYASGNIYEGDWEAGVCKVGGTFISKETRKSL